MKTKQIGILASILTLVIGSAMPVLAAPGGNRGENRGKQQVQRDGGERGNQEERRENMQKRFNEIDADGSGEVSLEELKEARKARVEEMKANRDGDRKGEGNGDRPALSDEQREAMKAKRQGHAQQVFKRADKDESGGLNEEEFRGFARHMHKHKKTRGPGKSGKGDRDGNGGGAPIED